MPMIPAGTYPQLRINGSRLRESKHEGSPTIEIFLEDPETGDFLSDFLHTTQAAWDAVTEKRLAAYGWEPRANDYMVERLNLAPDEGNPLAGKFAGPVVVKEEEFEGKTRAKVAQVGEYVREQMAPEDAKKWGAQLRQRLIANGGTPNAAARRTVPKQPPKTTAGFTKLGDITDDVPF